jgi:hypothetical protein
MEAAEEVPAVLIILMVEMVVTVVFLVAEAAEAELLLAQVPLTSQVKVEMVEMDLL